MGRNVHNLHVHVRTPADRVLVEDAVVAYATRAGFERVRRASEADRVIHIAAGRGPWLTLEDDGFDAEALAKAVSSAVAGPVLEAYCEASAIVWLALHVGGRPRGGWGAGLKAPPARRVAEVLAQGTPAELAEAWRHGQQQTFPEEALVAAATRFGIPVARLLGDTRGRGTTVALRRVKKAWSPQHHDGPPGVEMGYGSNQGYGLRHLVFTGEEEQGYLSVTSVGGPSRGVSLTFGGSAIAGGHVEIVSVRLRDGAAFVQDGECWRGDDVKVPAGLVERPDVFTLGRREADRFHKAESATLRLIEVIYRARREGECVLETTLQTGALVHTCTLELMVMWQPWRPRAALPSVENHTLFAMHRSEHVNAHITLRGALSEAWAWARPHLERWCARQGDANLRVSVGGEVVINAPAHDDASAPSPAFADLAAVLPDARTPIQAAGRSFLFGTFYAEPWNMDPRERLTVQLVLCAKGDRNDDDVLMNHTAALEALCDDAIRSGAAHSAIVSWHQYRPSDETPWEQITVRQSEALALAAWHETHVRGVDKRLWLSEALAARVDREALARHVTVTAVGAGLRLQLSDDRPRAHLEAVAELLGALVPTEAEAERWLAQRPQALEALKAPNEL
jgi:hypothetical protein